jgi:hypothetical protein
MNMHFGVGYKHDRDRDGRISMHRDPERWRRASSNARVVEKMTETLG